MPEPITMAVGYGVFKIVCWTGAAVFATYKASKAYGKYSKRQKEHLALKGKSLEDLRKTNEASREAEKKAREALEEQNRKNEEIKKELEKAKNKANDTDLSEEERAEWRKKVVVLEEELANGKNASKTIIDQIKDIGEKINSNSKVISGITSNLNEKHWVWELVTVENVVVLGGIYMAYKLLKDDKK